MAKKPLIEILPDLDVERYYEYDIVSNSKLSRFWLFLTGGFDYFSKIKPETLRFGQLLHTLVYEPEKLTGDDLDDIANLKPADRAQLYRMVAAAKDSPTVAAFLKHRNIIFEKPIYFLVDGFPMSIRPDALVPKLHGHDLKSTATRTLPAFEKACVEYKYFRQMYLYKLGTGCKNYYITGVSKTEPHRIFTVDLAHYKEEVKAGQIEAHELIRLYQERYPGYAKETLKLFNL